MSLSASATNARASIDSISFQPAIDSSTRISPIGLAARPVVARCSNLRRRRDPCAATTEDVRRANDHRQTDGVDRLFGFVERSGDGGAGHVEADLDHRLLEPHAILGGRDRLGVGADHLRASRHADASLAVQRHGDVQPGLSAERRQHRVGPLAVDDRRQHRRRQRLDVGAIGEVGVRHDRRRVRVGEDHAVALLAKHATGLACRSSRTRTPGRSRLVPSR